MINSVIPPGYWPLVGNFGLNTNLLETNLIHLGVVLSLLVYFGKGVRAGCIFR
jgi:F-type H+-transporting ATPase subunit b